MTPLVASPAVACSGTVPRTYWPGFVSEPVGGVWSAVTLTTAVVACPTPSAARASSARVPSLGSVQVTLYGADVRRPIDVEKVPVEHSAEVFEHSKNSTDATPVPVSAAEALTVAVAVFRYWPSAGDVNETVGGAVSTTKWRAAVHAVVAPAASVARACHQ